jgi:hypothetical protein
MSYKGTANGVAYHNNVFYPILIAIHYSPLKTRIAREIQAARGG